jgi:hypothetical protein
MNKLLVVFTRMFAERGGDGDEFAEIWCAGGGGDEEHLFFVRHPRAEHARQLLVLHAHGYPAEVDERVVERAHDSIASALGGVEPVSPSEVGVAFHPPVAWSAEETAGFARELALGLIGAGHSVGFVKEYRRDYRLQTRLAPLCRKGGEFKDEFDDIWANYRHAGTDYDACMRQIKHKIETRLSGLDGDLKSWEASRFDPAQGRNLAARHGGAKAAEKLAHVRQLVTESSFRRHTVANVVQLALLEASDDARRAEIGSAFEKLGRLFADEGTEYAKAQSALAALGAREPAASENYFGAWYSSVLGAFGELRGALAGRGERHPGHAAPAAREETN